MTGERWAAKHSFLQHKESLQDSILNSKPFTSQQYLHSCFYYANNITYMYHCILLLTFLSDLNLIGVLKSMQTDIVVWGKKIHTHWKNGGSCKTMLAYMSVPFLYGYIYIHLGLIQWSKWYQRWLRLSTIIRGKKRNTT